MTICMNSNLFVLCKTKSCLVASCLVIVTIMDEYLWFMYVLFGPLQIKAPTGERFTHILSVGIGGSALGPQFVAEALAPDNPPLKVSSDTMLFM